MATSCRTFALCLSDALVDSQRRQQRPLGKLPEIALVTNGWGGDHCVGLDTATAARRSHHGAHTETFHAFACTNATELPFVIIFIINNFFSSAVATEDFVDGDAGGACG